MTEKKKERKRVLKRQEILDGALKAFCEHGVKSTTIDDICEKVNCSHGLFYHYYKNKDELLEDLKNYYRKVQDDEISEVLNANASPSVKLKEILLRLYAYLKENEMFAYHIYFFLTELYRKNENGDFTPNEPSEKGFIYKLHELIKDGVSTGEFNDKFSPCELLTALLSTITGIVVTYLLIPKAVKENYKLPDISLITSSILKQGDRNEEEFNA